jgi:predicted transcriptional regulator
MKTRHLSKPTPVRLHQDTKPLLDEVARKFRLSPAEIIRIAVDQKLAEWKIGGTVSIASR